MYTTQPLIFRVGTNVKKEQISSIASTPVYYLLQLQLLPLLSIKSRKRANVVIYENTPDQLTVSWTYFRTRRQKISVPDEMNVVLSKKEKKKREHPTKPVGPVLYVRT